MIPSRLKRLYALAISIGIAVIVLGLGLLVPVVGTATDFSIYNTGWNGTSGLAVKTYETGKLVPTLEVRGTGVEVEPVIISFTRMDLNPGTSCLVIIGPSKAFSDADAAYAAQFLAQGGLVFLADDFGTGNSLLTKLGVSSRFSGNLIVDLAFEKKPEFTVAYNFDDQSPLTEGVSMMLLNYPSSISPGANATVLATTSEASWMDKDGNEFMDEGEPMGPFPFLTVERVGNGTLLLLSDPSVLINSMTDHLDNGVFVDNLLAYCSQGRSAVIIDESHRNYIDPISFSIRMLGGLTEGMRLALVVVILVAFFLATTDVVMRTRRIMVRVWRRMWRALTGLFRRERAEEEHRFKSDDELIEEVLAKHPDWRRGVVSRLLRQINRHGSVK